MARIKIIDYYNRPEYYRYMPKSLFRALESAFVTSEVAYNEIEAEILESDVMKMLFEKQLNEKPQQQ